MLPFFCFECSFVLTIAQTTILSGFGVYFHLLKGTILPAKGQFKSPPGTHSGNLSGRKGRGQGWQEVDCALV